MKSCDNTTEKNNSKGSEQNAELCQRKKRLLIIIAHMCILPIIMLSIGIGMHIEKTHSADDPVPTQESTLADQTPSENTIETEQSCGGFYSLYPGAWKRMNAVIVKWGDQNGQTRNDFPVDYVGVNVEFIDVFSETMEESYITDIEDIIAQTSYLMVPKHHLDEIKAGNTALVFLDRIATVVSQDANLHTTVTILLGIRPGELIAPDTYIPSPIFHIAEDKVIVNEAYYEIRPATGEYYMSEMSHLQKANAYICEHNPDKAVTFENGISVEDLRYLFAFICENH